MAKKKSAKQDDVTDSMIAAAPEMLRTLHACAAYVVPDVEHYKDGGGKEWAGAVPLLRRIVKVIAAAEGKKFQDTAGSAWVSARPSATEGE